jgi:acetylornithine deacetylase
MIDQSYTISILQKLVQINSVNPALELGGAGEEEIGKFIFDELNQLGIHAVIDELAPGRVNVTGTIHGKGGGKSLVLNAHMDTVGVKGMVDPFSAKIIDGKLYGRGAYDMKGSIAAILGVAKSVIDNEQQFNGDLIFSFVADEEFESIGAKALVKKMKADAAIVTEPSDLNICLAHRGFGVFKITTHGKTAHGGNHHLGVDANMHMAMLLAELNKLVVELPQSKKHLLCGSASMHIPLISGGNSLFIYSNACTAHIERRTLPGESESQVLDELKAAIKKMTDTVPDFKANLEKVIWRSPYEVSADEAIVKSLIASTQSVFDNQPKFIGHNWWEDAAIFGEAGIPTVIIGPRGAGIHEETEWVELDAVIKLAEILNRTSADFCGT